VASKAEKPLQQIWAAIRLCGPLGSLSGPAAELWRSAVNDQHGSSEHMFTLSFNSTIPPIPVSAVIVDLRNFTPHLVASPEDQEGISSFCHFLTKFYGLCLVIVHTPSWFSLLAV
jgi:hypothetical protein